MNKYHDKWRDENRDHVNSYSRDYVKTNAKQRSNTTRLYRERTKGNREHFIAQLVRTARANAIKKSISFNLTAEVVSAWITAHGERCALTHVLFDYAPVNEFRARPFAPSIDRRDNAKGYDYDNIQIVCCIVNKAKNEFTQDMFDEMCKARMKVLTDA